MSCGLFRIFAAEQTTITTMKKQILLLAMMLLPMVAGADNITKMLTTQWGQTDPFRQSCPTGSNGQLTPPGCGAVALGQIMNYYRANDHGFGHINYDYTENGNVAGNIDVDFSQCRFDWANMIDKYQSGAYTDTQSKAVSDFLFWMGAAIRMQYRADGSSPSNNGCTLWGVHHFLHISKSAVIRSRLDYSTEEWKAMLNANLQAHHPVYYGGRWRNGSQSSNHIFAIDGMDANGRYCVNYGVGNNVQNREDIDLNVLNQWGDGTLGGRGVCWNINSYMMTDLYPADNDDYIDDGLIIVRPLVLNGNADVRQANVPLGVPFTLGWRFQHYNIEGSTVEYRLCLKDRQGVAVSHLQATDGRFVSLGPGYYVDLVKHFKLPVSLRDGDYEMRFESRPKGAADDSWQPVIEALPAVINVKVENGRALLTVPVNHRRSPNLFLRENIRVVDNVYERQQPGTALLLAMSNNAVSSFSDTLRLAITLEGEAQPHIYETEAAVYDGCQADYNILIPDTWLNLKGKNFTVTCEYKDQGKGVFLPLTVKTTPVLPKCASPEIIFSCGKFSFECTTPGATFTSHITATIDEEHKGNEVELGGTSLTYTLTVIASAEGYEDSDPTIMTFTTDSNDVNKDGQVNVADITTIINRIAGK